MGLNVDLNRDDTWNEILTGLRVDGNSAREARVAVSETNVADLFSADNGPESLDVMEVVGREPNFVVDLNEQFGIFEGPISANEIGMNGTVVDKALDETNPVSLGEEAGPNVKQYLASDELVPDRKLEGMQNIPGMLIPERRGEDCVTEKEGQYYVSDLVWGKVRSHPWWPGQIVEPSAASERAMKYFKKDSYLISYFGSLNLAWNEPSKIKPFRMYFSQMEKHSSNNEALCHAVNCALDELAGRIKIAISCPCLLKVMHNERNSQVVGNVGIGEGSSIRDGTNDFAISSSPTKLVQSLKSLAEAPRSKIDRLEFVTVKAQFLAFNRWKSHHEFPFLEGLSGLLDHDDQITEHGGKRHSLEMRGELPGFKGADLSKTERPIRLDGSSQKRKYCSDRIKNRLKSERRVSDVMALSSPTLLNGVDKIQRNTSRMKVSSLEELEVVVSLPCNSEVKRRKSMSSRPFGEKYLQPDTCIRVGEQAGRSLDLGERSSRQDTAGSGGEVANFGLPFLNLGCMSHGKKMVPTDNPAPTEIHSKLCLAAKHPNKGNDFLGSMASLLCEFRNSNCLENENSRKLKQHARKHKEIQIPISEATDISRYAGTEDAYWKDIVIQNFSEDQLLFEPEAAVNMRANPRDQQENDVFLDFKTENPSPLTEEKSNGSTPMALILTFANTESIPSIANLNEIFSHYGPLIESETEVLSKSKRVKVFFKRRADAETVFNNKGLFGMFGPSLVSYRLKYYRKQLKLVEPHNRSETTEIKGNDL